MAIITISRGSYSHGKEVAESLASRLGYECLSRDILLEASKEFNIPEIKLEKALHDAPSILERFSHGRERYISYFRSAFFNRICKDNVVYHGLAGHFYLQGIPHILKVRIIANMADRIQEEVSKVGCSADQALYNLKRDDEERRKWGLHLYAKDTWDSRLYDLVLHIDTLTVEDVVDILYSTAQKDHFQTTPKQIKTLEERALLARVHASVVDRSPQATLRLTEGSVIVLGNLDSELRTNATARDELLNTITTDFDVKDVVFEQPVQAGKEYVNTFYNLDLN